MTFSRSSGVQSFFAIIFSQKDTKDLLELILHPHQGEHDCLLRFPVELRLVVHAEIVAAAADGRKMALSD